MYVPQYYHVITSALSLDVFKLYPCNKLIACPFNAGWSNLRIFTRKDAVVVMSPCTPPPLFAGRVCHDHLEPFQPYKTTATICKTYKISLASRFTSCSQRRTRYRRHGEVFCRVCREGSYLVSDCRNREIDRV